MRGEGKDGKRGEGEEWLGEKEGRGVKRGKPVGSARTASHPETSQCGEVSKAGAVTWHARLSKPGLATKGGTRATLVARQGIEALEWVRRGRWEEGRGEGGERGRRGRWEGWGGGVGRGRDMPL